MDEASSWLAERLDLAVDSVVQNRVDRLELVSQSMSVLVSQETSLAKIKVGAILAGHKGGSRELCIACQLAPWYER